jgi:hypothetical protein
LLQEFAVLPAVGLGATHRRKGCSGQKNNSVHGCVSQGFDSLAIEACLRFLHIAKCQSSGTGDAADIATSTRIASSVAATTVRVHTAIGFQHRNAAIWGKIDPSRHTRTVMCDNQSIPLACVTFLMLQFNLSVPLATHEPSKTSTELPIHDLL